MGNSIGLNTEQLRNQRKSATRKSTSEAEHSAAAAASRSSNTARPLHLSIDVPFLIIFVSLLSIGLLMVYSASVNPSLDLEKPPYFYFFSQLKWAALGLIAATVIMYVDYRRLKPLMVPMLIGIVLLLIGVLIFGEERLGATRSFAGGSIQPSEFAKPAVIIYLAYWLNAKKDQLSSFNFGLIPLFAILGIVAGLILGQPDMSAAATIVFLGVMCYFIAGGSLKQLVGLTVVAMLFGLIVVSVSQSLKGTGTSRITDWIAGMQNPQLAHEHIQHSVSSIVRGGLFGVGIGYNSGQFEGLPVAHTDSIFAIVAEETGLIGSIVIILLFVGFMWRGLKIASRAPDLTGKLLAGGLTIWIVMEAVLNIGVMVNLFPFAGNALPFFSAGGSSLITTIAMVGLIMNVARVSSRENTSSDGRSYSAVADLRWRDGRRRVSRSRRSAETR